MERLPRLRSLIERDSSRPRFAGNSRARAYLEMTETRRRCWSGVLLRGEASRTGPQATGKAHIVLALVAGGRVRSSSCDGLGAALIALVVRTKSLCEVAVGGWLSRLNMP